MLTVEVLCNLLRLREKPVWPPRRQTVAVAATKMPKYKMRLLTQIYMEVYIS